MHAPVNPPSRVDCGISRRSLLSSIGLGGLALAVTSANTVAEAAQSQPIPKPGDVDHLHFGQWTHDDAGLPCFDLDLEGHPAPYAFFAHILSTGTAGALVDQWGNIKLITTEDGPVCLTPAAAGRTRSGLYATLEAEGELHSFIYTELSAEKRIRYGTGYAEYHGEMVAGALRLAITQEIYTPPDKDRALHGRFTFRNAGDAPITGTLHLQSDVFLRPGLSYNDWLKSQRPDCGPGFSCFREANSVLGDVYLVSDANWMGSSRVHSLILSKAVTLHPGESLSVPVLLGYGKQVVSRERNAKLASITPAGSRAQWAKRLSSFTVPSLDPWMRDECLWALGQLYSFEFYDRILDEHYTHLGGYDLFSNPDSPSSHLAYTIREAAGNSIALSHFEPALAKSSIRWLAKMQVASGNIPKNYNYTAERLDIPYNQRDSDTEIWFLLALCEYLEVTGDTAFLDDQLSWHPQGRTSLWDHAKRTFHWITESIGVGQHGLILILEGDWNDYLSSVGTKGKGESVMNSGMAAKAFDSLARIARKRGDIDFAVKAESWRDNLRSAVGRAFDEEWFIGSYTDEGLPICGHKDRLYLNAQTWAALGGCGTPTQRRKALLSAIRECGSSIGLLVMSKAYSSPAPPEISWCPIPRGEGENGGIWPQTVHWAVWAMAQEGLLEEALEEWKKGTLRTHARNFPEVPYGIFNAPDCWSSRLAGRDEGWTQYNLFNRALPTPMCPAIAWQAFSLLMIQQARTRFAKGEYTG
jgi:hypothetical protein